MRSEFLKLLHEDERTEINKGTKGRIFEAVFPELLQTDTQKMYSDADCCLQRNVLSVLPQNTFTVQILYKLYSLYLQ